MNSWSHESGLLQEAIQIVRNLVQTMDTSRLQKNVPYADVVTLEDGVTHVSRVETCLSNDPLWKPKRERIAHSRVSRMIEDCDIEGPVVADIYYVIFNEDGDARIIRTEPLARKG